jgi:hypothetical protein
MAERIDKDHTELEEGTFKSSRDIDELNYALQSKSILDAHVAIETYLRSMHSSQPLIVIGKKGDNITMMID